MIDLEQELKRIVGEPPVDPVARDRALQRLRAQIVEVRPSRRASLRRADAAKFIPMLTLIVLLTCALAVIAQSRRPAVADELARLADSSQRWELAHGSRSISLKQMEWQSAGEAPSGPEYVVIVESIVTREPDANGTINQTQTVASSRFASDADEQAWEQLGSPPYAKPGDVTTSRLPGPLYNVAAIPSDPHGAYAAITNGDVTGYPVSDEQLVDTIGGILAEPSLSADQRNALYRSISLFPGIQALGETDDPLGRAGEAFGRNVDDYRQVIIFDTSTGEPLATEEFLPDGQLWQWIAFEPTRSANRELRSIRAATRAVAWRRPSAAPQVLALASVSCSDNGR